jgi:branched-chain amino acid transport system substrate-binding protein
MNKKALLTVCLIAVVVVGLLAFVNQRNEKHEAIRIGAVLPLTGGGATYGQSIKQGIDLAVEEVNASGGINGKRLEVIYEDSRTEAKTGVSAFNKLNTVDKVPLVFGSLTSVLLAIQPEADKNKVVLINSSAISPTICEKATDFLFNLMPSGESEAIFMAKEFQSKFPNEKIAIFYANNLSGVFTKDKFVQNLSQLGNSNVLAESYELNATDFRVQIDRIKRNGAKYGYLLAFSGKEFSDILRQTKELGLDIQWFSIAALETSDVLEHANEAAECVVYSYPKYVNEALYLNLQEKIQAKHGTTADLLTVISYDGVHLIAQVMKEYGTTALEIQKGLRSIEGVEGIFGNHVWGGCGTQCVERELQWKIIKNNQFKVMEDN